MAKKTSKKHKPLKKKASNENIPRCPACGRKLRKVRFANGGDYADGSLSAPGEHVLTADGEPRSRGDYGDNLVCGLECGYVLAIRLVRSVPGLLELLPPQWRPDLTETPPRLKSRLRIPDYVDVQVAKNNSLSINLPSGTRVPPGAPSNLNTFLMSAAGAFAGQTVARAIANLRPYPSDQQRCEAMITGSDGRPTRCMQTRLCTIHTPGFNEMMGSR